MSPWKVILATMVIFGCGVVTGGLLIKSQMPAAVAPDPTPKVAISTNAPPAFGQIQRLDFLRRMEKQLDLTPQQRDDITKIIKASQERSRPLWDKIAPDMRKELRRTREEIRDVLTPEQQTKMDKLLRPRQRRLDGSAANSQGTTNAP